MKVRVKKALQLHEFNKLDGLAVAHKGCDYLTLLNLLLRYMCFSFDSVLYLGGILILHESYVACMLQSSWTVMMFRVYKTLNAVNLVCFDFVHVILSVEQLCDC